MKLIYNEDYKAIKLGKKRQYFLDITSPKFSSEEEATVGVNDIKMITGANYYGITGDNVVTIGVGTLITFDLGTTCKSIISIGFTGYLYPGVYPSMVMANIQGSIDGYNWVNISTSYGGRDNPPPLNIGYNNYRYIRFTSSNDDGRFGSGGVHNTTIKCVRRGSPENYDYYGDIIKLCGIK